MFPFLQQARAEQEEEFISNTLFKKIQALQKEKETLAVNYEKEEEFLTNELSRKLMQVSDGMGLVLAQGSGVRGRGLRAAAFRPGAAVCCGRCVSWTTQDQPDCCPHCQVFVLTCSWLCVTRAHALTVPVGGSSLAQVL